MCWWGCQGATNEETKKFKVGVLVEGRSSYWFQTHQECFFLLRRGSSRLPGGFRTHVHYRSVQMASFFGSVVGLCACLFPWELSFGWFTFSLDLSGCVVSFCGTCWFARLFVFRES